MNSRITSLYLLLALLISTLLPQAVIAKEQQLSFQQPTIQGEIAYVKDGDIWLLDLSTGESRQLTTDRNNQWPTWSPDGRYLLYTHSAYEERFELYIFDTLEESSHLLASDSCCALWETRDRFYNLYVADGRVAIAHMSPNDSNLTLETDILSYGQGIFPTGNLPSSTFSKLPLEAVTMSGAGGLTVYADFFSIEDEEQLVPYFNDPGDPSCSWYNFNDTEVTNWYAFEYVREQGHSTCRYPERIQAEIPLSFTAPRGIILGESFFRGTVLELPWLAYPTFSPDGHYLITEQYKDAADPRSAQLNGLVLYELETLESSMLLADAGQPAWRPNPPVPDNLARYVQPGERVVTLEPSMHWGNSNIQLHVITTGGYRDPDATVFFRHASPTFFDDQQIVALLVTMNGIPMVENVLLKEILLDYATSAVLYGDPAFEVALPDLAPELQAMMENPAFQDTRLSEDLAGLFRNQSSQSEQALAAILTDQISVDQYLTPVLDDLFTDDVIGQISSVKDGLDRFRHVVESSVLVESIIWQEGRVVGELPSNLWLDLLSDLDELNLDESISDPQQTDSALVTIRALIKVFFMSYLQQERLQWLYHWISDGSWLQDRNQLRAVASIMQEAETLESKRVKIVSDLLQTDILKSALDGDEQAVAQVVEQLNTLVIDPSGYRLMAHAASSALTSANPKISAGAFLYGSGEAQAHFRLAEQASAWQGAFSRVRRYVQDAVQQNQSDSEDLIYDSYGAYKFRRIILLEALAAVEAQRASADGIAAVFATGESADVLFPEIADEWQEIVANLRKEASAIEIHILDTFARPSWLPIVVELIKERRTEAPVIVGTPEESNLPVLHPGWTSFTHSIGLGSLIAKDNVVWAGTSGGLVRWHGEEGVFDKVTTEHGLNSNNIRVIFESADGAVWFGTWNGVSRLDPNGHWDSFTIEDGLADNSVNAIAQSKDGALWFGTYDSGVSRLDPHGDWTTFTMDDGLLDNEVRAIAQAADGALWFGSQKGATRLEPNGNWTTFTTVDGLADNSIHVIFSDNAGKLWFGTGKGVSQLSSDGNWRTFIYENNDVNAIFQSTDDSIWFGTSGYGVSRYDSNGNWSNYSEFDGLAGNGIAAITQTGDGALWFSTSGGMSRFAADGRWTTFTIDSPSALYAPRTIIQSSDGSLWVTALSDGVSHLSPDGNWNTFTEIDGLVSNGAITVFEASNGTLWFGTPGGVNKLDPNGIWTTFTVADGLAGNSTWSITQSNDDVLWFGGIEGLSRLEPDGTWSTVIASGTAEDNIQVQASFQSADGTLWFGTETGINRLDRDGSWSSITTIDDVAVENVLAIEQSSDDVLWFGTRSNGVVRLDPDGSQTLVTVADGLAGNTVRAVFQSMDGAIWFGTEAGVSRLSPDGTWMTFTTDDGLADNGVVSITQSDDGYLWIGTWGGVSRLDLETVQ